MKLIFILAAAVVVGYGQVAADQPVTGARHLTAVKLVDASGSRERMQAAAPTVIESAVASMGQSCPGCNPAFFAEFKKRFTERLRIDDFVAVVVRAYEKRFTENELAELLSAANAQKAQKSVPLSPELEKKVTDTMPALMGEIVGGTTEVGGKLGADIGAEIQREHPEWFPKK